MIELAIDLGWNAQGQFGKLGDVVVAKLSNAVWAPQEQMRLLVVQRRDDTIEQALLLAQQNGDRFPAVSYPYLLLDSDGMTTQESGWRLDVTQLPINILSILRDPLSFKPIIFTPELWWQKVIPPSTNTVLAKLRQVILGHVPA